ncbi:dihydroorotate dehydrogenase [Enterovibrio norvegicus]|nr:SLC13 family permease [Enterovibrio norvegicus]MCC4800993.1 SLC13 family permease [Enterovibrio norvegicus]OEE49327.1 dihydroorotate dehydrogenase [Enterovibrio norvegicus]OEF54497.1 dihydroorotate dehydrogenase [Enterovibrio norvegicus]OEF63791.1 dihydroorotate dehydrogenase [Enterovibrio norvegicus]PMH71867.1 dihydroorotate dehydrogenase [Enterovibrio norvegicus]
MPRLSRADGIKFLLAFGIPLGVLMMPIDWIPIDDLTIIQHRLLAIFLLAALLWVLEPVPVFATSILIIALELIMISDKGLRWFREAQPGHEIGELIKYTDIFSAFSSPIIILFMGGFALAIAASKYELDNNLARVLLKPFGTKPKAIMLGLMLITAVFSMFMSNTATTVMMLALLAPIVASVPKGDTGVKALVLCIPIAANTGGIATPIGTPPNAIALQYLTGENAINFLDWMMMGLPFVIIQLSFAWWLLQKLFPAQQEEMTLKLDGKFQRNWRAYTVYATFAVTILLWMTTSLHGMNTYVVSIVPLAVFTLTGIMGKEELKLINWDVLWLVAGGIAIGLALDKTGLAEALAHAVDYDTLSPVAVVLTLSLICWVMANFMSNTATANLLMPIAAAVATSMESLSAVGGIQGLLVVVAFSASLGMILPVSTPPNSLAYSTGLIESRDMAKVGIIVGVVGLAMVYAAMLIIT